MYPPGPLLSCSRAACTLAKDLAKVVQFDDIRFFVSPIELQIPYRLYLGSDKDIEDAVYLWMLFWETLDGDLLRTVHRAPAGPGGAVWN